MFTACKKVYLRAAIALMLSLGALHAQAAGILVHGDSLSAGYGAKTQRLPVWSLALLTVAAFALCYFIAVSTGHWESALPPGMHQRMYQMFLAL